MNRLTGSVVALVTPFNNDANQTINYDKLAELVRFQAQGGTSAIVPCGTTGETPTLSKEEWENVIRTVITTAKGTGMKIIAGTGSYSTREAVHLTSMAAEMGADACLLVTPYYNKPTPEGLKLHFQAIDKVGLPMFLYNVPGRTGQNITPDTTMTLFESCQNLVGVKAANGSLDEITDLLAKLSHNNRTACVMSGDDGLTLPVLSVGGRGIISVAANIIPGVMRQLVDAHFARDNERAAKIAQTIHSFCGALLKFGANPMGIKDIMNQAGLAVGDCRLPLTGLTEDQSRKLSLMAKDLRTRLTQYGISCDPTLNSF
ncbi:MAG: 4-hydroxy-tetrahydrodipicolinate synthase [Deltaproteobacteria bacterium]|nr:4-hydroxy-tetrahydrodipicolinate synthase [Deltaproteobacteria bacterium]